MLVSDFIKGLRALIDSGDQLPTLPTVIFQLHAVLADERAGNEQVAAVIERDPALTARLLRAANSAAFARGPDRVASVLTAIQRLGTSQVRALCLVLAVVNAFKDRRCSLNYGSFWAHCASVGMVARLIWARARPDASMSLDDMYVAGLLHDIGLLVVDQFFPEYFDKVVQMRQTLGSNVWQAEQVVLGMHHGDVGGALLGHWGLPESVVDAVTYHHRPAEARAEYLRACRVVAAAEIVCTTQGWGLPEEGDGGVTPEQALIELGLPDSLIPELLLELEPAGEHAASMLG